MSIADRISVKFGDLYEDGIAVITHNRPVTYQGRKWVLYLIDFETETVVLEPSPF